VSEDAAIEPRTVATLALALAARRYNLSARSHPQFFLMTTFCIDFYESYLPRMKSNLCVSDENCDDGPQRQNCVADERHPEKQYQQFNLYIHNIPLWCTGLYF
jgi:hypothetical protein